MKLRWLVLSMFALSLTCLTPSKASATAATATGTAAAIQDHDDRDRDRDRGWDAPPSEFREAQRQGFHDGIEGARKDFDNHRPPNPENRDEFRHPHVARDLRDDYREGFRQGYERAMSHMNSAHY
jgi:Ni/Co efflux regulator RcnB